MSWVVLKLVGMVIFCSDARKMRRRNRISDDIPPQMIIARPEVQVCPIIAVCVRPSARLSVRGQLVKILMLNS